jgi:uridine kinase
VAPRGHVIDRIADHLVAQDPGHPLRVAVDGITASGKTTLARELAAAVEARGRPALHVSMDGFHHPRAHRHRQGRSSADGYYEDAYDLGTFARDVLRPLGPGGGRMYRGAIIDLASDDELDDPPLEAPADAILIVDGSFLQRAELAGLWDEVVFVHASFEAAHARGTARDAAAFGSVRAAAEAFEQRYHAACRRYLDEVHPAEHATIVVGNEDPTDPSLERIGGRADAAVRLFSYGTLQLEDVQRSSFGRVLEGHADVLPGHRLDWVTITDPEVIATSGSDRHPIVSVSDDSGDTVDGTVFTVTTAELAAADVYEVADYRRVHVTLASGVDAWVYLAVDAVVALD